MFKKGELKLLSPFYAHSLIFNLTKVIMPFYVLYFLGIGLSFLQISLISGIRSAVAIIFEIPTGVIADKYGRKNSVIFGYLFTAVSLALIPLSNNFYIIAAIFAIDAFFETFIKKDTIPILPKIKIPALICNSVSDKVVHPRSATHIYKRISSASKKIYLYPSDAHTIMSGAHKEDLFQKIQEFIKHV